MIRLDALDGLRAARDGARARHARLRRFEVLHTRAGKELAAWVDRNFAAAGALHEDFPAGWPPLARATLGRRRRASAVPLQDTGRLRRGVTVAAGARRVRVSNPVPYASVHQLGLGVPRRPFFPGRAQAAAVVHPPALRWAEEAAR